MDDKEKIAFLERSLKWFIDAVGLVDLGDSASGWRKDSAMYFYDSGCGCCSDSIFLPDELATFIRAARATDGKGPRNGA